MPATMTMNVEISQPSLRVWSMTSASDYPRDIGWNFKIFEIQVSETKRLSTLKQAFRIDKISSDVGLRRANCCCERSVSKDLDSRKNMISAAPRTSFSEKRNLRSGNKN